MVASRGHLQPIGMGSYVQQRGGRSAHWFTTTSRPPASYPPRQVLRRTAESLWPRRSSTRSAHPRVVLGVPRVTKCSARRCISAAAVQCHPPSRRRACVRTLAHLVWRGSPQGAACMMGFGMICSSPGRLQGDRGCCSGVRPCSLVPVSVQPQGAIWQALCSNVSRRRRRRL